MRPSTSSREKPKVIWVRSLVPKEKKSATSAISPANSAARGVSIMVPIVTSSFPALVAVAALAPPLDGPGCLDGVLDPPAGKRQLLATDREGDHDLDDGMAPVDHPLAGRFHERAHLHGVEARLDHAEADTTGAQHRVGLLPRQGGVVKAALLGVEAD